MAELVYAYGLGPYPERVGGSSPLIRTTNMNKITTAMQRELNGTIRLTITIPNSDVKKTWEEVLEDVVKNAEVSGFRKGKAPKNLVEEKIDKEKVREEVLRKLLPVAYTEAIQTHGIKPIINPKIHMQKLVDPTTGSGQEGWQFTALTCEAPIVDLNNYKDNIKSITAKSKIIVPGKSFDKAQDFAAAQPAKFEHIVKALLDSVRAEIPGILIDNETDRLLSQTLEDVKKLGLTLDQYLTSTGKNPEILRNEYRAKAENDIKLEFALLKIAEEEKITVEEKEISEAILAAKTEDEKKNLESNRYLLASILRQQKTLDFLKNL